MQVRAFERYIPLKYKTQHFFLFYKTNSIMYHHMIYFHTIVANVSRSIVVLLYFVIKYLCIKCCMRYSYSLFSV